MLNWKSLPRHIEPTVGQHNEEAYCCICNKHWSTSSKPYTQFFVLSYEQPQDIGACTRCQASGRHRLMHYAKEHSLFTWRDKNILYISPESQYEKYLVKFLKSGNTVICSNINPKHRPDVVYDITNIDCASSVYDVVFAIHVLEHIESDIQALDEMTRVLRPQGKLIVSVPQSANPTTFQSPDVNTRELRMKHYLWEDHVRLYGRDFSDRYLKPRYTKIETLDCSTNPVWMKQQRLLDSDVLHICTK